MVVLVGWPDELRCGTVGCGSTFGDVTGRHAAEDHLAGARRRRVAGRDDDGVVRFDVFGERGAPFADHDLDPGWAIVRQGLRRDYMCGGLSAGRKAIDRRCAPRSAHATAKRLQLTAIHAPESSH